MDDTPWILLDTETTGLAAPIYVVELAAQCMRGWQPDGPPFRRLLNHGVAIPPEATRVNGYTREILERDGEPPRQVYTDFATYVADRPLVAYNLGYDLDEVLRPEWERLGVTPIGRPGFCALRLAQRLLDPVPAGNCKLQTLRQYYRLPERGAHTALGDVETVADLLQQVLRPLAEQRGLRTWEDLSAYAGSPWYPSRIAFGKFKGRHFREARDDAQLHGWLRWLASSSNPRSADIGHWYLQQLDVAVDSPEIASLIADSYSSDSSELVIYLNPELETLRQLIAGARARVAELEAEYTREHHAVRVVQSQLFALLRPHYQRRDELRLVIQYRRKYLDILLVGGEDEAEAIRPEYQEARAKTEREYEEAAAQAAESRPLSDDEQRELKTLFRKLVRLYHPDRYEHDPEKRETFARLTAEINRARERGDIQRLREIADDPLGFLFRQGWGSLDFEDGVELTKLRRLYESLQLRIVALLDELNKLKESSDYVLCRLSSERPELLKEIADQQAEAMEAEITELEAEAAQLAEEIKSLTGIEAALGH
jgi:DNA polymerase-3 subunit epsilon